VGGEGIGKKGGSERAHVVHPERDAENSYRSKRGESGSGEKKTRGGSEESRKGIVLFKHPLSLNSMAYQNK